MNAVVRPGPLTGAVRVPPSKSASHRALLCAALAGGESVLQPLVRTDDMEATMRVASALGAQCIERDGRLVVQGTASPPPPSGEPVEIDCAESGSTLRFAVPVAAALGLHTRFVGRGRLPQRPMTPLTDALAAHGVQVASTGAPGEILTISGRLQPGVFRIPGNISSQYVTGLLVALPLLDGESEIFLSTPLASRGYVDMTLSMLARFGAQLESTPTGWRVPGPQRLRPQPVEIEGDFSAAAFWLCAAALGGPLTLTGLDPSSMQGDRAAVDILQAMGARIDWQPDGSLRAAPPEGGPLRGCEIDATHIPDLVPALAVAAACAQGVTHITGAARLRDKESDRLRAVSDGLSRLGAVVQELDDGLFITGKPQLGGGEVDSFADHRIAMAMSVAAIRAAAPVTVRGAHCVAKSYPEFYQHFRELGGICDEL